METLRRAWQAWNDDKAQRLAASIAYSTIFALAPLFIVLTAIVGELLGTANGNRALSTLLAEVQHSAGPSAASSVRQLIGAGFSKPHQGLIAQAVGWIAFLLGAAGAFAALQDSLNAVWGIESTQGGWRRMVRDRTAAFGMVVAAGFVLLVSLVANATIAVVVTRFAAMLPFGVGPLAVTAIYQGLTVVIVTVIFALIFKVLPAVDVGWRDVWLGGFVTAVLFVVGELLIAWYFAVAGVASAYGAAGSILAALLWIYYSALIMLFGAEFTKIRAGRARLEAPSTLRSSTEKPAGADPREVAGQR